MSACHGFLLRLYVEAKSYYRVVHDGRSCTSLAGHCTPELPVECAMEEAAAVLGVFNRQ